MLHRLNAQASVNLIFAAWSSSSDDPAQERGLFSFLLDRNDVSTDAEAAESVANAISYLSTAFPHAGGGSSTTANASR